MLYHNVKSRCVAARVFGARWAFMAELVLPDGKTAGQLSAPELVAMLPKVALLTSPGGNCSLLTNPAAVRRLANGDSAANQTGEP